MTSSGRNLLHAMISVSRNDGATLEHINIFRQSSVIEKEEQMLIRKKQWSVFDQFRFSTIIDCHLPIHPNKRGKTILKSIHGVTQIHFWILLTPISTLRISALLSALGLFISTCFCGPVIFVKNHDSQS